MRAEFDNTLITGDEMIDSQHQELIGKINTLLESCEEGNDKLTAVKTLDYLAEYGEMTDEDLQALLNIKKTRAYLLARQMHENGLIDIIGRGAGKKYKLK